MDRLYDTDLVLWSEAQARALRAAAAAGWNAPIDWQNVAEEIESLGRSERHALAGHIATVIEHLLKLQASPATEPARGWRDTIRRARGEIEQVLEGSLSLRRKTAGVIARQTHPARALVRARFQDYDDHPLIDIDSIAYGEAQVLGDWFPDNDSGNGQDTHA